MSRRRLLAALTGGVLVSACTREDPRGAARPSPTPTAVATAPPTRSPSPEPEPTEEPPAEPAPPAPYEPLADDVYTNAKRVGGRVAQGLVTYEAGEALGDVLARAAEPRRSDLDPATLASAVAPVHHGDAASTGEVVYVQLGGLHPAGTPVTASTMVVVRQQLTTPGGAQGHTRTIDVRVRLVDGEWVLDTLGDAGGEPVERPLDVAPATAAVLDDERIDLPDSARWDIHRGEIDERLLAAMARAADHFPYSVCSLRSGHPRRVFGTDRTSNHTHGRAVDVWAVDGVPVVHQQPQTDSPAHAVARAIYDEGVVPELGAPWAFDGPGGRSFQNDVHRDHLHLAFYARR